MEKSNLPFHYFGNDVGQRGTDIKPQGCARIWRAHLGMMSLSETHTAWFCSLSSSKML